MSRAAPSLSILVSLPGLSNQHLFATFALNRPISGSCGPDQCRMSMPTVPKRRLRNEETMLRAYGARTRHAASGRPEIRTDPIALWRRRVATLCRRGDRSHPLGAALPRGFGRGTLDVHETGPAGSICRAALTNETAFRRTLEAGGRSRRQGRGRRGPPELRGAGAGA